MKIVKCSKCGKFIHKADQCYHCGNIKGFSEVASLPVHKNIATEYDRMNMLIESRKYDAAITLSYTILEWMPNLAGAYWLRLLARRQCSTAYELLKKGFPCDDDPDFCNALNFATGEERIAYEDLKNMVMDIRSALMKAISTHEAKCKAETNIMQIKNTMAGEVEVRKQKLFSLWSELEGLEHSLYVLEMDCRLLTKEHQTALAQSAQSASAIKTETYKLEECTAEALHSFQVRMGDVLQQSEQAKDALESMKKQHPWVKNFADLVSQRNQKVKALNSEVAALTSYQRTVQQTISEIERIESRHKAALRSVEKYDFTDTASLLGQDVFGQIIGDPKAIVNFPSSKVSAGQESAAPIESSPSGGSGKWSEDDYYSAWGLDQN